MILLTEGAAATTTGSGMGMMIGMIVVYVVIIYFFIMRPQKKQQKQHTDLLSTLENGDYVLTSSGFYGTVIDITEDTVIVEFGNNKNCRIPMKKEAIVEVEKAQ